MDLVQEALRLRLDVLAVEVSQCLADAGIPHALLKGPSTSLWLYDPPRPYSDVDMLVPLSRFREAWELFQERGFTPPAPGGLDEDADHSAVLLSPEGFELDLHVSLPTVPPAKGRVWDVLSSHVEPLDLGVGVVPALDEEARCVVLALHALGNRSTTNKAAEDLRRARSAIDASVWQRAPALADQLGAADLFGAGVALVEGRAIPDTTRARLRIEGASEATLALERIVSAPWREKPRLIARELWPSRDFLLRSTPELSTRLGQLRARVRRWFTLLRQLPRAASALDRAARNRPASYGQPTSVDGPSV